MSQPKEEDLGLKFPCEFKIKAMGKDDGELQHVVVEIIAKHCQKIRHDSIACKPSKTGKYISVNVTIEAESLDQLNAIYDELTAHEKVLMRL